MSYLLLKRKTGGAGVFSDYLEKWLPDVTSVLIDENTSVER